MSKYTSSERIDYRDQPTYAPAEAAHYLSVPVSTVRYWSLGRDENPPLIIPAQDAPLILSFVNLVELHVLSAIRRKHSISMPKVRRTLEFVQSRLGLVRPLSAKKFMTDGVDLFVEQFGQLINASQEGQLEIKELLGAALVRIEWDESGLPLRLFPYTRGGGAGSADLIMIDPAVSGGRAVIRGTRIAVEVVAERYKAGESISELAEDYGRQTDDIEEAIRCELKIAA